MKSLCSDIVISVGSTIGMVIGFKAMTYINKAGYKIRVNDTVKIMNNKYSKESN